MTYFCFPITALGIGKSPRKLGARLCVRPEQNSALLEGCVFATSITKAGTITLVVPATHSHYERSAHDTTQNN